MICFVSRAVFTYGVIKPKPIATGAVNLRTNHNMKKLRVGGANRGKTRVNKYRLVLVLLLIS